MPASDDKPDEPVNGGVVKEQKQQQPQPPERSQTTKPQAPLSDSTHSLHEASDVATHTRALGTKRSATGSGPASANPSPSTSRDTSPIRPTPLKLNQNIPRLSRSRKNSQDLSPSRTQSSGQISTAPSAAAVQRALSAAPRLASPANNEAATDPQKPSRNSRGSATPGGGSGGAGTPGGQNSATASPNRVRSPPSSTSTARVASTTSRKNDQEPPQTPATPRIVVDDSASRSARNIESIAEEEDDTGEMLSGIKSPVKSKTAPGTLEAVQESSLPETPAISAGGPLQNGKAQSARSSIHEPPKDASTRANATPTESGSESGGGKSTRKEATKATRNPPTTKPAPLKSANSFTQGAGVKAKPAGDGSSKAVLVETETVNSVANAGVGSSGQRDVSGRTDTSTLRLKPSSETIRPKKDKKKVVRKGPSIQSGTASSKADIFEAKVASAVDEADSSDSEETFVYESNPPEPHTRPNRYHSRTPSAASTASQADFYGNRYRPDGANSIVGKKSMKFANSAHQLGGQGDAENASHSGTLGSNRGSTANGSHYHHHIGRHGRAAGHTSLFDSDSPFTNSDKRPHQAIKNDRIASRPNSPRSPYTPRAPASAKSHRSVYNLEDDVADDERTPLIRNQRARHSRRPPGQYDSYGIFRPTGVLKGAMGYLVLGLLISLLIVAVVVALVLCSKPLHEVRVRDINNVIASEEEIVFDLHVHAVNPNIVAVQISRVDIKIFAKSKYVGSSRTHHLSHYLIDHSAPNSTEIGKSGGVDEGTDPIEDGGGDTMLLGQIRNLDSPLTFDPSPTRHKVSSDTGQVSCGKPGNTTVGGDNSAKWKVVVQHTFELIVTGQLIYTLPISSQPHSVSMGRATISVNPDSPVDFGAIAAKVQANAERTPPDHEDRRVRLTFKS